MTTSLPPRVEVDWSRLDVPTIWQRLQHEDDYFSLIQVGAWNRTAELLDAHRVKLESLFATLAAVWPPTVGSAAEKYLIQLRELIASVAQTHQTAATNAYALDSMVDKLMSARAKIETLSQKFSQRARREPAQPAGRCHHGRR